MEYTFNKYQSSVEELQLENYPQEVQEQFWDIICNVPFVQRLISPNRPYFKDLPRDEQGKVIIDITDPPILTDMDYFRPTALHYQKTGVFTKLRPNSNPNSDFGKWIREEVRRCYEGYVRKSDGAWITGDMYFFLNYWPIMQTRYKKGSKKGERIIDFPEVWDGIFYRYNYIDQAINGGIYDPKGGNNGCEISSRGKSKSYCMSSMMGKRFVLGESKDVNRAVKCMVTAYQKQYLTSDGILNKFQAGIDFLAQTTQFPSKRLKSSLQDMAWKMGYRDLDTGTDKGTLNEVLGVSAKDDSSKVRGKRQNFIVVEEFGSFKNVLELYNIMIPSVQEGDISFGSMYLIGTAGDEESDFSGAQEIVYNPKGYRMYGIPNVYDKDGQGRQTITFFFPGYLNRKGCYDKDGNSNVTKALLEILSDRYRVKYNSTDVNSITKTIAEIPITPQEAVLRTKGNVFPITQLNERITQIDNNPNEYDDVWCGDLVLDKSGEVKFKLTNDLPIRIFPLKDNTAKGCVEIFEQPEKNKDGKVQSDRYIIGFDPYDNDQANSMSLGSALVLDLFTDRLVAEYTGRTTYAEELYEKVRLLCLYYNAKCMYEANIKGTYSYFSKMNCSHLLADTPEYLRDKQILKYTSFGNNSKGVRATAAINNYADALIKEWLIKPVPTVVQEDGEDKETTIPNLYLIRNRALLKELVAYNPFINVDRVRALGQLMLFREEKIILYQGDVKGHRMSEDADYAGNDEFFLENYDKRFTEEEQNSFMY